MMNFLLNDLEEFRFDFEVVRAIQNHGRVTELLFILKHLLLILFLSYIHFFPEF